MNVPTPFAMAAAATMLASFHANAGITAIRLYHDQIYTQDAGGVTPAYSALSNRELESTPGEFTQGTVTRPTGVVLPLGPTSPISFGGSHTAAFGAQEPKGTYTFALSNPAAGTSDTASLVYSTDAYPISVPTIANFSALKNFDPTKPFDLTLASGFIAPSTATRVLTQVLLFDNKGLIDNIGAQSASQTVFAIPAGTIMPRDHVALEIAFYSFVDGPPAADGASTANVFRNITDAEFTTVPEPGAPALALAGLGLLGLARVRRR